MTTTATIFVAMLAVPGGPVAGSSDVPLWRWPLTSDVRKTQPFESDVFRNPPAFYWPGYFWMWNAPLEPELLKRQLREMASNGAKSVCMLPMPREFRPDSTNNSMDPGYLTDGFFDRVSLAMQEAQRLGMHWWIYDEGGWPSGQACGQVAAGHPELSRHIMVREAVALKANQPYTVPPDTVVLAIHQGDKITLIEPGRSWQDDRAPDRAWLYRIRRTGGTDLLNPKTTNRFIELTHRRYGTVLEQLPAKPELCFTFTDEPAVAGLHPGRHFVWTEGAREAFRERFGYDIFEHLDELFTEPAADAPVGACRARVDYCDFWTRRFCDAYFEPLRTAARQMGMLSGGHLGGEDETLGAVYHGYGHILRTLRAMDLPGVDVIWRQLFPGKEPRHHFPKFAGSAAHQIGRRLAFTESMAVYGNGVTPEQIKWVLDYQFVRGIQIVVMGCYPLSTRDHHMTGERPHFGPVDPIWPMLSDLHAYIARTAYTLSCGEPRVTTALYYPSRDLWAHGRKDTSAAAGHDQLARALLESQCEFDILDDDILSTWPASEGQLIGPSVRYATIVFGPTRWLSRTAAAKLAEWLKGSGVLMAIDHLPGVDGDQGKTLAEMLGCPNAAGRHPVRNGRGRVLIGRIGEVVPSTTPVLICDPPHRELRATARDLTNGEAIYFVFNEGLTPYRGRLVLHEQGSLRRFLPQTGRIELLHTASMTDGGQAADVAIEGMESLLIHAGVRSEPASSQAKTTTPPSWQELREGWMLRPLQRHLVGEHDFEIRPCDSTPPVSLERLGPWAPQLTADFSGRAEYRTTLEIPTEWANRPLVLDLGKVEYACEVYIHERPIGKILWRPWRITLPPLTTGKHALSIVVSNTLANELTSDRVRNEWSRKKGPGWPSPYHERALRFEMESRGGGLFGPVRLGPAD